MQRPSQRPRPQRAPTTSRRDRAAKAAAAAEATKAEGSSHLKRSRPGLLMAEEVAARAHSQWALMEATDLQAAAAETAAISKVESALPAPLLR